MGRRGHAEHGVFADLIGLFDHDCANTESGCFECEAGVFERDADDIRDRADLWIGVKEHHDFLAFDHHRSSRRCRADDKVDGEVAVFFGLCSERKAEPIKFGHDVGSGPIGIVGESDLLRLVDGLLFGVQRLEEQNAADDQDDQRNKGGQGIPAGSGSVGVVVSSVR